MRYLQQNARGRRVKGEKYEDEQLRLIVTVSFSARAALTNVSVTQHLQQAGLLAA